MHMRNSVFLLLPFLVGCAVNSFQPMGSSLEMNVDVDLSRIPVRHGWTYLSQKSTVDKVDQDAVARGQQLYLQHCEKCHGPQGKGDGALATTLKLQPTNLANLARDLSRTYLIVQINQGKGSMPEWQDLLTAKQTADLTDYIRTLNKK